MTEGKCICAGSYPMCEDSHSIDCPASSQYEKWLAMQPRLPLWITLKSRPEDPRRLVVEVTQGSKSVELFETYFCDGPIHFTGGLTGPSA